MQRRQRSRARTGSWPRELLCGTALLSFAAAGCASPGDKAGDDTGGQSDRPSTATAEHAKDSVLVRFRTARTPTAMRSALARVRGSIVDKNADGVDDRYSHIAGGRLAAIALGSGVSVEDALAALRADPDVLYAEPNYIVHTTAVPNDPRFPELYGLNNSGQTGGTPDADIDAVEAWDSSVGSPNVVVAVIDTGVDYTHEDLAANMWVNPGEIPANGIDDDDNGYIDDVHGINAINGSGNPLDDHFHGTHCAGTIGAVGDNGIGVAGVNWQLQIMAIKFLDEGGSGTIADAITAVDYAIAQRAAGVNLRVLSNSWGGGGFSQALLDAITTAGDAELLFVAAAGNSSTDTDEFPHYPSSFDAPSIVSVAATDHDDLLADFSNFGAESVDLGAPGVDILSTFPGDGYDVLSGTSMATPHVAGVAALVLSSNETLTTDELKEVLLGSGDPDPALEGITVSGRRLNAAAALEQAGPPVPRFSLGVSPTRTFLVQGDTATFTIDVDSLAGFAGDVALTASADPAIDATVTITPSVTAPGTGTLTVATTPATARGVYQLTVTGQSGDLVRTRTVSLRVLAPGDPPFGLTVSPPQITINQGDLALFGISVESFGATGSATLRLTSDPPLFDAFIDPDVVSIPGSSNVIVFTDCSTEPGDYTLTVTAENGGVEITSTVILTVLPFGSTTATYPSSDTPLPIPDADPAGVASAIEVGDDLLIADLAVEVDITHPAIGDLVVELVSPDGGSVALHDREGGGGSGIHRTYPVPDFDGASSFGTWTLRVSDNAGTQVGTLDSWALRVSSTPTEFPPFADFFYDGVGRSFQFFDNSFSGGGCGGGGGAPIIDWAWDFGDGTTSSEQNPEHLFAAAGDYDVTLTVTDENGLSGSLTMTVTATRQPLLSIFRITRDPSRFEFRVDLRWRDAEGDLVELYRNGDLVDIPDNDGQHQDRFRRYQTTYTWTLCEQRSDVCSNQVLVVFGPDFDSTEATITLRVDGREVIEKVTIEDE